MYTFEPLEAKFQRRRGKQAIEERICRRKELDLN